MAKTQYPTNGRPLADVPEIFQLNYDKLGKDAFKLMNERFSGHKLVVLDDSELVRGQPIGHSNSYRRFALGPIVGELVPDAQLITPAFSEIALINGRIPDAKSTYEDLALVVYSLNGPNSELAKHLVAQAKERGLETKEFPIVFYGLKTAIDDKFPNGLRFDLGDSAVAYHAPILSKGTANFDANDPELVRSGLPSELGKGDRTLYTGQNSLRRLVRVGDLSVGAGIDNLPYSVKAGRVSFVKRGAAPQNLESAISGLEAEKRRQIDAVEARFGKALEILKG